MSNDEDESRGSRPSSLVHQILKSDSEDTTDEDSPSGSADAQDHNGLTALMKAAIAGNEAKITALLESGVDINVTDRYGKTALIHAAKTGGVKALRLLIEAGADTDGFDSTGNSALTYAISDNRQSTIELLLRAGVDVNAASHRSPTPLVEATERCFVSVVTRLLQNEACVNLADYNGVTALHVAARKRHPELVSVLVDFGADVNAKTKGQSYTPLVLCLMHGFDLTNGGTERIKECVEILVKAGSELDLRKVRSTTLSFSILLGDEDLLKYLLNHGLKVAVPQDKTKSILSTVVSKGSVTAVEYLLQEGTGITTELHQAVMLGKEKVVQTMIRYGAMPIPMSTAVLKMDSRVKVISPLTVAFLYNKSAIAKYFFHIRFMLNYDLHVLPINSDIIHRLGMPETDENRSTLQLYRHVFSQPWKLANISFLALSNVLGVESGREKRICATGLPDFIQRKLMFKDKMAETPVEFWDDLDIQM
ncbi:unnamed protein product [Lymnaea stagnalis]|uniref:Ankyrin repeat protein n=1 Tax=Lymnaea stagnalis TaxID=6523 RepID=A0AAV2I921_LYMST